MDKLHTIKKSYEFSNIIHSCSYIKTKSLIIYYNNDNGLDYYRFGISVSKKLGNAVHRNKYKRQMRYIIDKYKKYYQNGYDYIIILKNGYVDLDFESKENDFVYSIKKINSMVKEN